MRGGANCGSKDRRRPARISGATMKSGSSTTPSPATASAVSMRPLFARTRLEMRTGWRRPSRSSKVQALDAGRYVYSRHWCRSKIVGMSRLAVRLEIRRRGAADQLRVPEAPRNQPGRPARSDANRKVEPLLDEVGGAIRQVEIERQLRMAHSELGDGGRQVPHAKGDPAGQPQSALRHDGCGTYDALRLVELRQQLHAALVERLPRFGE